MAANVSLSQTTTIAYSECDIAINPSNPLQIIAASNDNGTGINQAQYYSSDGGKTWGQSSLPLASTDSRQGDPAVAWTPDGTAWALTLGILGSTLTLRCYRSSNGGKDWTFDSSLTGTGNNPDKESLWVDHVSARSGNLYAIWHDGATAQVAVRQGKAGTWTTPLQVSGSETTFTADGTDIKSNGAGDVFAFWPNAGSQSLLVAKSTDGGASFTALSPSPVTIASTSGKFTIKIPAQANRATASSSIGTLINLSGGAYSGSGRDDVYACWHDLAGGTGCNSPANAPGTTTTSACKTRVWFARSTDGGQNWSAAVKINDQAGKNDQFFPRLAVDDDSGRMMIIYYDTVNDANRVQADIWMQYSTDFGGTWSPAIQVTTLGTDEAVTPQDNAQEFGDYIGLSVAHGRFFGCWTDRRGSTTAVEQIWGAPLAIPEIGFVINKATFGQDEVIVHTSWPKAFWLSVQGFTNEALGFATAAALNQPPSPAPNITVTLDDALNSSLTSSQRSTIRANLPAVSTFGPSPIEATDPSLVSEMQQFLYPYTVSFAGSAAFNALQVHEVAILTLHATFTVGPITVTTSAPIELTKGEDPYFTDTDPDHPTAFPTWLSYDLRFFKVTPTQAHTMFGVPNPSTAADAPGYITSVLDRLNNPSLITNGDTFETTLQQSEELSALEFLADNSTTHDPTFNFAVARVRILASSVVTVEPVRVFFRLFPAATTSSTFTEVGQGQGSYRWGSNGTAGHKIALLGVQTNQSGALEYSSVPCFASRRVNLTSPADMNTQIDSPNARSIVTSPNVEVDSYFGCWLDINQPGQKFLVPTPPSGGQSNWDGPWTGTSSINSAITAAPHQCLIAEIRYDDTPIPNGASGTTSDKLAQRNIAWIDGPNPGAEPSRVMPHPFEIRASDPASLGLDELLVTWGNTPKDSIASFYLPEVDAAEVIVLADRMYRSHQLVAFDSHTIQCPAAGISFIPVPPGAGHYAGLLSLDLPPGIRRGDIYDIGVQQLSPAQLFRHTKDSSPNLAQREAGVPGYALAWRQLRGAFQVRIPITMKDNLLYPEERLLAWIRWRISVTEVTSRWLPVLRKYEQLIAGRVLGFDGNPNVIGPSPSGDVPGHPRHPGHEHDGDDQGGRHVSRFGAEFIGKVVAVFYDRFGDFEGFTLLLESGHERTFHGREPAVERLVKQAWVERILISVLVDDRQPEWPSSIALLWIADLD